MVVDMGYWSKVIKRIIMLLLSILGFYLLIKLSIFYIPFVIAFVIAMLIEPLIKRFHKRTRLPRKTSAIIVLIIVAAILIALITWGIITLISESYRLLGGINGYTEKIYNQFQNIISSINLDRFNFPKEITGIIQNSFQDILRWFIKTIKQCIKFIFKMGNILTSTWNLYCCNTYGNIFYMCR